MKKQISLTIWGIISIAAFLMLANIALGIALVTQSQNAMKSIIDERMLDLSNTAASLIDGDALAHITEEDENTPEYRTIYDTLMKFETNIELEYIYTLRQSDDGSFYFVIDPSLTNPSEYGEIAATTEALISASKGVAAVDQKPYTDNYGRFYSAYSPVFTSDGKIAGVLAADFDADWYDSRISESTQTVIIGGLVTLLLGGLIVFAFASRIRKRLTVLADELGDLSDAVDDLTREITQEQKPASSNDDQQYSTNTIQELEQRVRAMRANLTTYLDAMHSQANSMVTALSSDYRSVYYINLDDDEGVCYQAHTVIGDTVEVGESFPYLETFKSYADKYVTEDTREAFLNFINPDSVRKNLEDNRVISCLYLIKHDGRESYEMLRMAGVRDPEDRDDHIVHAVGAGFTDVDAETRNAMAKNQALSDALLAAEEANKAKTAFLSSMSHEIRTPMNAIIGLDHIALSEPGISEQTRENLVKIGDSANHLLSLINDILDMSRIESGRMSLRNENFHLSDVLNQVNTIVEGQCRDKGLDYRFDMQEKADGFFRGDETKLRQVLINILGNAVKFTPKGGEVSLAVQHTAHFEDKTTIRFIMKDSGIGISEEFLPKIFDPFSQEDSLMTSKYGSTGLGMPITKNIVEMMNGTIQVESVKGEGTTFYVTITFEDADQTDTETEDARLLDANATIAGDTGSSEHTVSEPNARAELEGRRVLVAEDIELNAEILIDILDMRDISADHAENGQIAVDMFAEHPMGYYDAILMDMRMPVMDGLTATATIRALERPDARAIPIIAFTANAFDEDVQNSLQAGLNAHLSKPVDPDILFDTLEQLIRD